VNQFIEECRREWRRLRVPKSIEDEMAEELETDLVEACAEGVTPEEIVGTDARSFARSWAAERTVARRPPRRVLLVAGSRRGAAGSAHAPVTSPERRDRRGCVDLGGGRRSSPPTTTRARWGSCCC
jgi:hypothetical protein